MSEHTEKKIEHKEAEEKVTYIATTDFRGANTKFGIKPDDRTRHMYIIGKTGMGKSTLLENMIAQDIINGEGVCFIDPHGSSAEKLLKYVPENRIADVVYFAPFDMKYPVGLNILEKVSEEERHLVASGLMDTFKKIFEDQFSGRMVYILNNIVLALLENEGQSLIGINRMLSDKHYRNFIVSNVTDPAVRNFWQVEFASYTDKYIQEATPAIQNKIGQFISNPLLRNVIGQPRSSFDVRKIMDQKKILIANLSIGLTGKENVDLIGSMLITKIFLAALSRANLKEEELKKAPKFYFFVDEFQNFVNESFTQILSQARKYNLSLTVAHQYIEQLTDTVKAAVFGNVGSLITFRVGAEDAEKIEKEFAPQFTADDIVNLGFSQIYLRLSINGSGSKPFSAKTLPPIAEPEKSYLPAILAHSRMVYGKERHEVEDDIKAWYNHDYAPIIQKIVRPSQEAPVLKTEVKQEQRQEIKLEVRPEQKPIENRIVSQHHQVSRVQDNFHQNSPKPIRNNLPNHNNINKSVNINSAPKVAEKKPNNNLRDALNKALSMKIESPNIPLAKKVEQKNIIKEVSREELEKILDIKE